MGKQLGLQEEYPRQPECFTNQSWYAGCEPEGALYVFPSLTIPGKAQAKAIEEGLEPDFLYCQELLESTGIVAVPGSGFGQARGPACASPASHVAVLAPPLFVECLPAFLVAQ